jgi:PKD domain/GEVED domain
LSLTSADTFWVSNNSVLTLGSSATVGYVFLNTGSLSISANTLTVQPPTGNNASFIANTGTLSVSGTGTLTINGNLSMGTASTLNQSGGDIIVDGNNGGVAASSVPSGVPLVALSTLNMSMTGGTMTIVDPHTATVNTNGYALLCDWAPSAYQNTQFTAGHTMRFGNGGSTDAGGHTSGFYVRTYAPTSFYYMWLGSIKVEALTGTNRQVQMYSAATPISGNILINSGDFRLGSTTYVAGNITVNAPGLMTNTSTIIFTVLNNAFSQVPNTVAQTVSGNGGFRNNITTSTANFLSITINNTSATGVTFASANSLLSTGTYAGVTLANTGTTSSSTSFTNGIISSFSLANPYIIGVSGTVVGSTSATSGGFSPSVAVRRWITTGTLPTLTNYYPFVTGSGTTTIPRYVFLSKSAAWTTGGWIQATFNDVGTTSVVSIADGAYTINQRDNDYWSFTTGGGINIGATTLGIGMRADNILLPLGSMLGAQPRVCQAATVLGTHVAATGSTLLPQGNRSGLTAANLVSGAFYLGMNKDSSAIYSITNGNWENPTTWSTNTVPTATSTPIISAGTTVTTTATGDTCTSLSVLGTLVIGTGSTLGVAGTATSNNSAITSTITGTVTVSGGTLRVGPYVAAGVNKHWNTFTSNGTFNMNSGNCNIFGSLQCNLFSTFNQSGGTIRIDGNASSVSANSGTNTAALYLQTPYITLSGGTIIMVDPTFGSYNVYVNYSNIYPYRSTPIYANPSFTLQFGDGVSTDTITSTNGFYHYGYTFYQNGMIYWGKVIANGNAGSSTTTLLNKRGLTPYGMGCTDLQVNANSELRLNYYNTYVRRDFLNNGNCTQAYSSSTYTPNLYYGITLVFGEASGVATNNYTNPTPYACTFGGTGTFKKYYTDLTLDSMQSIAANTPLGLTMNRAMNLYSGLSLCGGYVTTTSANLIRLCSPGIAYTIAGGYVNGPLSKIWGGARASSLGFVTYPVGNTGYKPFFINPTLGGIASNTTEIMVERFNGNTGTVDPSSTLLANVNSTGYWKLDFPASTAIVTSWDDAIADSAIATGTTMAHSTTAAGLYKEKTNANFFTTGTATLPNNLQSTAQAQTIATYKPYIGWGNMLPIQLTGVTASQVVSPPATLSSTNNAIIRVNVAAAGYATAADSVKLNSISVQFTGYDPFDCVPNSLKLWAGTATTLGTQIGTGQSISGVASFTGFNVNCINGFTFLWVTVDVNSTAIIGDYLDAKVIAGSMNFSYTGAATGAATLPALALDPSGTRPIGYCLGINSGTTTNDTLKTLQFNHINYTSGGIGALGSGSPSWYNVITGPSGYADSVERGGSYPLIVGVASGNTYYWAAYADWNQNGSFGDQGDAIDSCNSYVSTTATGTGGWTNIKIPATANLGITTFRIRYNYYSFSPFWSQYCSNFAPATLSYGTTTDMNIKVIPSSILAVDSITGTQGITSVSRGTINQDVVRFNVHCAGTKGVIAMNALKLRFKGSNVADVDSVTIWTGTNAAGATTKIGTASIVSGVANFSGLTDTFVAGNNPIFVRVNVSATATANDTIDFFMNANDVTYSFTAPSITQGVLPVATVDPTGYRWVDLYCKGSYTTNPTYNVPNYMDSFANITINNINRSVGYGSGAPYYYTLFPANNVGFVDSLMQQATIPVSLRAINGFNTSHTYGIWIDYNQNGSFQDAGEWVTNVSGTSTAPWTSSFTVPATASLGQTRMRVRSFDYTVSPSWNQTGDCIVPTYYLGSTVDFNIKLIPPPNCSLVTFPTADTTLSTLSNICQSDSAVLTIKIPMPLASSVTYSWQRSATISGVYTTLSTTVAPTYKAGLNFANQGYYRCVVNCNGSPILTCLPVQIIVTDPAMAGSNSPQAVCGPDTSRLTATTVDGGAVQWYSKQKGGSLLFTGNAYNRAVSAQDTVWAGAQSLGTSSYTVGPPDITSVGAFSNYGTPGVGTYFSAPANFTLNSVDIYCTTAGNLQLAIFDSATGTGGTPLATMSAPFAVTTTNAMSTVPCNIVVSGGSGRYIIYYVSAGSTASLSRNTAGAVYPYTSGPISILNNVSNLAGYYYFYYNWSVTTGCVGTRIPVITNYTSPPVVTASAAPSLICPGSSTTITATSSNPGYAYVWNPGSLTGASRTVTPTTGSTTYTVSASDAVSKCKYVTTTTVLWKNAPATGVILAEDNPVCIGVPDRLISVGATMNLPIFTVASYDFNGSVQGWALTGVVAPTGGVFTYNPLFTWYAAPTVPTTPTGFTNGYLLAYPDGTSSTYDVYTEATSPTINTTAAGYTNLALSFKHFTTYYNGSHFSDTIYVRGSTNGGSTWSLLKSYTATQGSATAPLNDTIPLPGTYNNNANVKFQYYYRSNWGFYWGLDDISVNAYNNAVTQKWTPISNLYTDSLGTSAYASTAKDTIYFKGSMAGTQTVYCTATSAGTGCTSRDSINIVVTATCGVLWTGALSTDWHNAGNWDPNVIPNSCNFDVVIPAAPANKPTISASSVQVGKLTTDALTITLASSKNLSVCKDIYAPSVYINGLNVYGSGSLIMNGTTRQTVRGRLEADNMIVNTTDTVTNWPTWGNVTIRKGLTLQSGVFLNNPAASMTLLSNSKDTVAYLNDFGTNTGRFAGNLSVQRQISTAASPLMQHYMSCPVLTDFNHLGFAPYGWGSHQYLIPASPLAEDSILYTSPYSTAMEWVESNVNAVAPTNVLKGWRTMAAADVLTPGKGYSVWMSSGTKFTVSGTPNTGNITVSGCTNSSWTFTSSLGHTYTSGYNLVGNPYPSGISLAASRSAAGFDGAVIIYQPTGPFHGTYQSYTIGGGTPPTLPPFQAFLARKTVAGGTASFPFFQTERNTNLGAPYRFYKSASESHLGLTVSGNGFQDATNVEFNAGATNAYDAEYDADKIHSDAGQPTLYTLMTGRTQWTAINVLGSLSQTSTVPVGFEPGANGNFTISVNASDISSFDPTTYIYLEDKQSSAAWIDLRTTSTYSFSANATDVRDRFVLHFTPAMEVKTQDASCAKPGKIDLNQPGASSWNYTVADNAGNTVQSGTINSSTPVSVNANTGTYTVTLVDANNYTVTKTILVNGSQSVIATFNASKVALALQERASFSSTTVGATSYEWSFGDGTTALGSAVNHSYTATGKYTVTLKVTSADGCQSITTQEVSVSANPTGIVDPNANHAVNVFSFENKVMVDFTKLKDVDADITIYNLIGQELSKEHFNTTSTYVKALDLEAAFVVVKVKMANGQIATKKLFISNK